MALKPTFKRPINKTTFRRPFVNPKSLKEPEHKINGKILHPFVRLVGDNIESAVYDIRKALDMARELGVDLVEIAPQADPPVCRLIEYNKFLYEKKKKEKELKAKKVKNVIKEVRFTPGTDDHDFNFKLKHAINFLGEGAKVKAYVQFRGRNIVFKDRGELMLLKFIEHLVDYGAPEALPKLEGNRMHVMISPKKK